MAGGAGGAVGILFDKDGVLLDFQATWAVWAQRIIADLSGGDATLARHLADALDFDPTTARFRPSSFVIAGAAHDVSEVVAAHLPQRSLEDVHRYLTRSAAAAAPVEAVPLRPVLAGLRERGLKLGVATNDAEAAARAHIGAMNVARHFDFIAGSDSGYGAKPAPGMCLGFAEAMGLPPERLVMVGDSTHDMVAGRAAGFTCVAVLSGVAGAGDLAPHADAVLPDIAALSDWLDG